MDAYHLLVLQSLTEQYHKLLALLASLQCGVFTYLAMLLILSPNVSAMPQHSKLKAS